MKYMYHFLKKSIREITQYYFLLVEETKSQRLVGSTNEWVLDNYYMVSEQEKELKEDLRGKGIRQIEERRMRQLVELLQRFLERCHYQIDKTLLFRYLSQVQAMQNDYLTYTEVRSLLPLLKTVLIMQLADLCKHLREQGAYHYSVIDKSAADMDRLNESAHDNLMMMNIFNSLKKMTRLTVNELIDKVSYSDRMLKGEKVAVYDQMYDRTKDDYRDQIIRLAKKRKISEYDLVKELVAAADARGVHVGFQLFPPKRWQLRSHLYIWILVVASLLLSATAAFIGLGSVGVGWLLLTLLLIMPMCQLMIELFNWLLGKLHKPKGTFKIKFKDGLIPDEYATMVIMPTILKNKQKTVEMLEQLEIYYLSNINRASEGHRLDSRGQNLYYTLVGDAAAAAKEVMPWDDEVAEAGEAKVRELNEKYGAPIFNFVYRRRAYSEGEACWLGYERKRGAILHFNDLLLGRLGDDEKQRFFRTETVSNWREQRVPDITFIITLDTDTQLVLYSAHKLVGSMAHPLNRARLSADGHRVDAGYGIMQPRVNVDVEVTSKSRYAQLMNGLGGLDVYTTASFELYQGVFNEGSFCGKGIYDLRVFQQVLKGTFPENLILSHDLLEGCHIRCGLITDVELFDDSPSNYIDDAKRHHRWTRGDWQIISWQCRRVRNERGDKVKNQVNTIGKWKIFDNLRRSMMSLAVLLLLLVGVSGLTSIHAIWYVLFALAVVSSPILFFIFGQITKVPSFGRRYHYYARLIRGFRVVLYRSLVQFAVLPKEAWMNTDAAVRACYRMFFSHRNLLNWVTSDEAAKSTKGTLGDYIGKFWFNYVAAVALVVIHLLSYGTLLDLAATLFCAAVWCVAPLLMWVLGYKFQQDKKSLQPHEREEVAKWARDTWNYFDSLLSEEHHYLIPDNYQLNREHKADYKTSPTNIGYSLTSIISAAELGFINHDDSVLRLQHIIDTVLRLEKWNGHLFNWYHIDTLKALPNFFISTCDSGNFVACLYVVKGYLKNLIARKQNVDNTLQYEHVDTLSALVAKVDRLIVNTDFSRLYNPELDVFSIGFDYSAGTLLPYHYNNFASEARLTSFLTIAQGDAPYKHWFCLDKTLVQYKGYKGVVSWYGTLFEYFMPLIFLPTYKHTLMDETYGFAIRAQRAFVRNVEKDERGKAEYLPWGISETAYNELDNAQNYKYHAFGVPYLKFQNTTPDRIVISPYSSLMAIGQDDRAVYENMQRFKALNMYDEMGFFESFDDEDHVSVKAHYAHHQGMILASLANYLGDHCLQRFFMCEPVMLSMETLLKEKAQVRPYIDLKITKYKRFQYGKEQTESDVREYDDIAVVPETGVLSNGEYTVLLNDRGSGFSRFRNIMLNRYRKITSDHYGTYLFIRNLKSDKLWSSTYAPLDVKPNRYRVSFASDKVEFSRLDDGIETKTEVTVLKDHYAEIRRYTFLNTGEADVDLELTSYAEVVLAPHEADESHRVFNSMQISSHYDADHEMLILSKPVEDNGVKGRYFLMHKLFIDASVYESQDDTSQWIDKTVEYETSRLKFLGRGGSLPHAELLENRRNLSGMVGTVLDPIVSMRRRIHVPAGKQMIVFMLMGFSKAQEQLVELSDTFRTAIDVDQAFKAASVFNNMRTAMSLLKGKQMRLYNSISKYLLQTANLGADRRNILARNRLSQSSLWRFGISGDLPILLVEIDSVDRSGYAKEMMRAFEYYKVHGLNLDLVFINDVQGDEAEGLTHYIRNLANTDRLWASNATTGRSFVLNGGDLSDDERVLLHTVARLVFNTREGLFIQQQLERLEQINLHYQDKVEYPVLRPSHEFRVWSSLDFYNQYGGFDNEGRDYVVTNPNTPMPWVNVLANTHFGCVVSSSMAGFTFANNAQQFKLTSWSNDIVSDSASEMLLINKHQFVPATARHSQGYSAFDAEYPDMKVLVRLFVSSLRPEKYYQIRVVNKTGATLPVALDMVCNFVLGKSEEDTARYLYYEWDAARNSLSVRNVYHEIYRDTTVVLTATMPLTDIDIDFPNRKRVGMQIEVPAGGEQELAFVLGVRNDSNDPSEWAAQQDGWRLRLNEEFDRVCRFWDERLGDIQVETPDKSFNYMLNRWYLYQVYAARLYARAGFYQVGGATGFRDQLQDVMSCLYSDPAYARRQILDHAAHQFAEGDVLHWWHESMHLGARTTFSDDYLWLIFVTYQYVKVTGDKDILTVPVSFAQADLLAPGENERCLHYVSGVVSDNVVAGESQPTLYDHLCRAIDRSMHRVGVHGLPLMGCGDWNDGMSRVGTEGKGESVWVAFFLVDLLPKMERLTQMMPHADLSYCADLANFRCRLVNVLQDTAWDGAWFLRAYFDNSEPMGSRNNMECQIDLISQAWSILTDVATDEQKASIFRETDARLVNREHEIIQLLTPAFQKSVNDPGYIMRYPAGVRENGGQYTHGAMWYIMAQLKEGRTDMAYFLYSLINPIHRTSTLADVLKYKVEPFCIAADIYSNPQHPGRGGWTWYTGSASWAYKTGIENILGFRKEGDMLTLDPRIPSEWDHFTIRYSYGSTPYIIRYRRGSAPKQPVSIQLVDDGQLHEVDV